MSVHKVAAGCCFDEEDPLRWTWLGEAVLRDAGLFEFMTGFPMVVREFARDPSTFAQAVFVIGRVLARRQAARNNSNLFCREIQAETAVSFFRAQCAAARKAVDTWSILAARAGVVKDIRILIGKLIWEDRESAHYKCNS